MSLVLSLLLSLVVKERRRQPGPAHGSAINLPLKSPSDLDWKIKILLRSRKEWWLYVT